MQQNYAKVSGVTETIAASALVEEAVRIHTAAFTRHGIELVREYEVDTELDVDRHKVLQILVNLISNAMNACNESENAEKRVRIHIDQSANRVRIGVIDTGVGILPENLTRIFEHGFTTRRQGHGFGLHSCALAAKELGGKLEMKSEGKGKGATFVLELPVKPAERTAPTRPAFAVTADVH